jgi:hypothetical protein
MEPRSVKKQIPVSIPRSTFSEFQSKRILSRFGARRINAKPVLEKVAPL